MSMSSEYLEQGASEFEEAYSDPDTQTVVQETFDAKLLEQTVEVLEPPQPICVSPTAIVSEVVAGMAARNHGCVLVVENGVLIGIFTERDVMRRVVGKVDPKAAKVRDVMTKDPEAVMFHDTVAAVLNKMTLGGFRHVPLVDIQRKPVGVVSMKDVVEYFVDRFPNHVLNVPPDPSVRHPDEIAGAG